MDSETQAISQRLSNLYEHPGWADLEKAVDALILTDIKAAPRPKTQDQIAEAATRMAGLQGAYKVLDIVKVARKRLADAHEQALKEQAEGRDNASVTDYEPV